MDPTEASTRIVEALLSKVNLNALVGHEGGRGMAPEDIAKEVGRTPALFTRRSGPL